MYENIIVGIDGHRGGRDAAALARTLAAPGARRTLVYVAGLVKPRGERERELEESPAQELPARLEIERELCGPGANVVVVRSGSVGTALRDLTADAGADLVVVGATHRHGLARILAGDDVRDVLHECRCALAIAPVGYHRGPHAIRRIGVAYDGGLPSQFALEHAHGLANRLGATVTPVNVVPPRYYTAGWGVAAMPMDDPDQACAAARRRLEPSTGPDLKVLYGDTGTELRRFSAEVDLLVCGAHHHSTAGRWLLGSTSEHLAKHAAGPLLIVPAPATVPVPASGASPTDARAPAAGSASPTDTADDSASPTASRAAPVSV
ncbi:MAG TPA: universal stress protein [Solirubrobacteraceae bacterium]|nr:universal stress protein [Solirubrobacteraceae bacterium]